MAARKKRAARKTAATKTSGDTESTPRAAVVKVVKSAAQAVGVSSGPDTDPRPAAWREILIAYANDMAPPRHLRVLMDDRFTGKTARTMVAAGKAYGKTPEESVESVLVFLIAEAKARGDKHTETL